MGKQKARKPAVPAELFSITSGRLGPLRPADVEIKPLTVLIGGQGTGKSLLAQLLYFFRGLPTLVRFDTASRRPGEDEAEETPKRVVRRILDGMRSSHRSFAGLTVPNVTLRWQGALASSGIHGQPKDLGLNVQTATSDVNPKQPLASLVEEIRGSKHEPLLTAAFVPTERLLHAMALGPTSLQVMSAPIPLQTFARMMEVAGRIQSDWPDGVPDTAQGKWIRDRLLGALRGEAHLRGNAWRWEFDVEGKKHQIDLDMASSGQRANWPLSIIPQVLFSLRARGDLADGFTLYVEEPEIHLHPDAERAVIEVLAYLVRNGMRVVITTHSLTVLYTINNLLMASRLSKKDLSDEIPAEIRLQPEDVAAYHLKQDGSIESLLSDGATIDEEALARVADALSLQMNRILAKQGPAEVTTR